MEQESINQQLADNIRILTEASTRHEKMLLEHAGELRLQGSDIYNIQTEQRRVRDRIEHHYAGIELIETRINFTLLDTTDRHKQLVVCSFACFSVFAAFAIYDLCKLIL